MDKILPLSDETDELRRQLARQQEQINALLLERSAPPPVERRPVMKGTERPRGHRLNSDILYERYALIDAKDVEGLAALDAKLQAEGLRGASPASLFVQTAHTKR